MREVASAALPECEGPLVWFPVGEPADAAILECQCGYVVISGSFNDAAHAQAPVIFAS